MALFRMETKVRGRGKSSGGRTPAAASAYLSGHEVYDEYRGKLERGDVKRQQRVMHAEVMLPEGAPEWMMDQSRLWYAAEMTEDAYNRVASIAIVAREWLISLPHEWNDEQKIEATRLFIQDEVLSRGLVADFAIHEPEEKEGVDQRNWHTHILISTRSVDPTEEHGFSSSKAYEPGYNRDSLIGLRECWEHHVNGLMEEWGYDARVDMRSHRDRGDGLRPEPKIGPQATAMEREGKESHAGNDCRRVRKINSEIEASRENRDAGDCTGDQEPEKASTMDEFQDRLRMMDDYQKRVDEQTDNLKKMHEIRNEVTPEERLRRDYQSKFEFDAKEAERHESSIKRQRAAEVENEDIRSAGLRSAEALAGARGTDWLSRSYDFVAREGAMAAQEHQKLNEAISKETDEQKKEIIRLQINIQHAEYNAKAYTRISEQNDYVAGHSKSEYGERNRGISKNYMEQAKEWRADRAELVREQRGEDINRAYEKQAAAEKDKAERQMGDKNLNDREPKSGGGSEPKETRHQENGDHAPQSESVTTMHGAVNAQGRPGSGGGRV